jgi:protein-histidine pros-kinase
VKLLREPVVCQKVIDEIVSALRPLAERKGLELKVQSPSEEIVLQTDPRALSQIMLNLGNNAIKFTEQGEVRLTLARHGENGRSVTTISVSDTGTGIRAEDRGKLFQAFEQIRTGGARNNTEGTGLGLHLSQKLAGLLGGRITFLSEQGKGSTFTLEIPEP